MKRLPQLWTLIAVLAFLSPQITSALEWQLQGTQERGGGGKDASLKCDGIRLDKVYTIYRVECSSAGFWTTDGDDIKRFNDPQKAVGSPIGPGEFWAYPNLLPSQRSATVTFFLTDNPTGAPIPPGPGDAAIGPRFLGTWVGRTDDGKFREEWEITNNGGTWNVMGNYYRGTEKVGGFKGRSAALSKDTLRFQQVFHRLPDPTWAPINNIEARVDGETLTFQWDTGDATSEVTLRRMHSKNHPVVLPLIGRWGGTTGDGKFREVWQITRSSGYWNVVGTYFKENREMGGFKGQGIKYLDGQLQFQQVFHRLPDPTWARTNNIIASANGDTLNFNWNTGKDSGQVILKRIR